MITREDIRELAQFRSVGEKDCALSFYFAPRTPQNKSHREEAILAKDLVRHALQEAGKNGKNGCRSDLDRILELAGGLHGNQSHAKAVFACSNQKFWREFDLPAQLPATELFVSRYFHLKPLAALLGAQPAVCVALVDRHKARVFDLRLDELKEREGLFRAPLHLGRSAGYDGGHAQRRVADEALHHFKDVAERLREASEKRVFEALIIGCHDASWHELEAQLHPDVKKRLVGRFSADVGSIANEQIREQAGRILRDALDQRRHDLVREVLDQARSNSRGVTGLRRVLRSLEMGEVQTLLIGESFTSMAVQCDSCGHIAANVSPECSACGKPVRELEDVGEAIIPIAIRRDIELFYVKDEPEFEQAGNVAALLRFRSDQNKSGETRAS